MAEAAYEQVTDSREVGRIALFKEFWSYFSENRGAVIGLFFFIAIIFIAVFADFIAPHQPNQQYRDAFLQPPFWQEGGSSSAFLSAPTRWAATCLSRLDLRRPIFAVYRLHRGLSFSWLSG
jgi:ABC-type antimicrobial peptide transport system permease subunit